MKRERRRAPKISNRASSSGSGGGDDDGAGTDDCRLSFVAGRLQLDFHRKGALVRSHVLNVAAIERLAIDLETLAELSHAELDGGILLERTYARSVSRQLRALASVLRVARALWSHGQTDDASTPSGKRGSGTPRTVRSRR